MILYTSYPSPSVSVDMESPGFRDEIVKAAVGGSVDEVCTILSEIRLTTPSPPTIYSSLNNALHAAATEGHEWIMQILLPDVLANLNSKTVPTIYSSLNNALHAAADEGKGLLDMEGKSREPLGQEFSDVITHIEKASERL